MTNTLDSFGRIKVALGSGNSGWPFAHILTVSTTNANANYTNIAAGLAGAGASNTVALDSETFALGAATISPSASVQTLRGLDGETSTLITSSINDAALLNINQIGMNVIDIRMTHSGAGTTSGILQTNSDSTLLRNLTLTKNSGAPTTAYGIRVIGGSSTGTTMRDCIVTVVAGTSKYALLVDTAASNVVVNGGVFNGTTADIRVNHASATVYLLGPRLIGGGLSIAAGTVKGWYYDVNNNIIFVDDSGHNSGAWLIDESLTLQTKKATLATAITASASGDSIKLDTDTYSVSASQNIDTSITIEGDGPEATIYTTSVSNAPIFDITTDNITVVFKDLTIRHTGGGVAATGIFSNNSGVTVILDNAVLEISSGAGTASRGLWIESGTWILRNGAKIVVTSGTSKYGIYNDAGVATITIGAGCTVNGATADVYSDQAGSTLNLLDCILTNAITDFAGTKQGTAFDQYGRKLRVKPIGIFAGRMTLTTATPVTTADVTAATTIYLTPYNGGEIEVYNGYLWIEAKFTELSLSLSGFTADKNSDLWVYDNAGTLALERTQWTNDTTRATALALQDGLNVKSGTVTRLYCGTFRTTGTTGQCEDSVLKRYVWNNFNRITKSLVLADTTSETTNTASWRQYRASSANQVNVVVGLAENVVDLIVLGDCSAGTGGWYANSFGYDSTTSPFGVYFLTFSTVRGGVFSIGRHYPAIGYHYYALIEITSGAIATSSAAYLQGGFAC